MSAFSHSLMSTPSLSFLEYKSLSSLEELFTLQNILSSSLLSGISIIYISIISSINTIIYQL